MSSGYAFCNVLARGHGLDPVGHAPSVDLVLGFELPLPWPYAMWDAPALPAEIRELVRVWYGDPSVPRPRLRPVALAPEPAADGLAFVALWSRPAATPFARYHVVAHRLPADRVGPLVEALLLRPEGLDAFARWRIPDRDRHLFVCTHGTVDAACGRFGFPAYRALRAAAPEGTRVWRASHFGGHLFAPTVLDLPTARYWAFVEGGAAGALVGDGDPAALRGAYRGWGALDDPFLQAAEREAWLAHGAGWPDLPRAARVERRDDDRAEVRVEARPPEGAPLVRASVVTRAGTIRTPANSGEDTARPYAQYVVSDARWSPPPAVP